MRCILTGLVLCFILAATATAAPASAVRLRDGRIVVDSNGKSTPLPEEQFSVQPIEGAGMHFLGIGEDAATEYGVAAGLYIFKGDGEATAFAPAAEAEYCGEVRLSPSGDILAMDAGTWLVRSWFFFSFPDMKPMGEASYYQPEDKPALLWAGGKAALFSSMETDGQGRTCDYDPCGPVSVNYYLFEAQKTETLLQGTDLCDYTLAGFMEAEKEVVAQKLCFRSVKDWQVFPENARTEEITEKFPLP